jgi:hypothetical protein
MAHVLITLVTACALYGHLGGDDQSITDGNFEVLLMARGAFVTIRVKCLPSKYLAGKWLPGKKTP